MRSFRWVYLAVVALVVAQGLWAHSRFSSIDQRLGGTSDRLEGIIERLAKVEQHLDGIIRKLPGPPP